MTVLAELGMVSSDMVFKESIVLTAVLGDAIPPEVRKFHSSGMVAVEIRMGVNDAVASCVTP